MKTFEMTELHVELLRNMVVSWSGTEFGAPEINPKRPYGNSDVLRDMRELLEPDVALDDEGNPSGASQWTDAGLEEMHVQTETALQIVLATGSFEPGLYEADDYRNNWRPVQG